MDLTTDTWVLWQWGFVRLNATIVFSWAVMALLVLVSWLVTRHVSDAVDLGKGQVALEVIVTGIREQIDDVAPGRTDAFLPFIGTLFLFIATCNLLLIVPVYRPPTGSLSTASALAFCVFVAVPLFGVADKGLLGYLKHYVQPNPIMLPFNILGELSRTLALAIRLFGNIMSGTLIGAILLSLAPLLFPAVLDALGLLTGLVQAYVFAVLSLIYLASATRSAVPDEGHEDRLEKDTRTERGG